MKILFPEPGDVEQFVHQRLGSPMRQHVRYYQRLRAFLRQHHATTDPAEAAFVFMPMNLVLFQFCNVHDVLLEGRLPDPYPVVERMFEQYPGKRLLLFTSADCGQRRRSRWESKALHRAYPHLYRWLDERVILIAFESTADLLPSDIGAIPYVFEIVPPPVPFWHALLGRSPHPIERDLLYAFAGAMAYQDLPPDHIRGERLLEIAGRGQDWFVGSAPEARKRYGKVHGSDIGMLRRARFTLCPAGYGRWSFRFFQALVYGSIPVLLADGYRLPFSERIPWQELAIVHPESKLADVDEMLRNMPQETIQRFQVALEANRHHFLEPGALRLIEESLETRQGATAF